jgi:hypothetical protein
MLRLPLPEVGASAGRGRGNPLNKLRERELPRGPWRRTGDGVTGSVVGTRAADAGIGKGVNTPPGSGGTTFETQRRVPSKNLPCKEVMAASKYLWIAEREREREREEFFKAEKVKELRER